jgi:hypothetical protein
MQITELEWLGKKAEERFPKDIQLLRQFYFQKIGGKQNDKRK